MIKLKYSFNSFPLHEFEFFVPNKKDNNMLQPVTLSVAGLVAGLQLGSVLI